jgi:aminopeptidase-like protein
MGTQEILKDIFGNLLDLNRNLVSDDFEKSLDYLKKYVPLNVHQYRTGTKCWTWDIPPKWILKDAYIKHGDKVLVSLKDHPLHVMCYSHAVHQTMPGKELLEHIYTHKEIPEAIPYESSFYIKKWGFCLMQKQKEQIHAEEQYEVSIDSELKEDYLTVGQYTVKGKSREHIFLLSHLDHPFQANDGLVGVAVNVALAKLLEKEKGLYYNYTFLFLPETIGSVAFLSGNEKLIFKIRYAIFNEMVGLNNPLVVQRSYKDRGLINQYAENVLRRVQGQVKSYPFLTVVGNDEKVFDSPGVNIPSISLTRVDQDARLKKIAQGKGKLIFPYPQYHSHLDNLSLVNEAAVYGAVDALYLLCQVIEKDFIPKRKFKGPVFLTKYGLWVDWRKDLKMNEQMMWLMYHLEGKKTAFQIAEELGLDFESVVELLDKFYDKKLITKERIPVEFDRAS